MTDSIPGPDPAAIQRDYAPQLEYCATLLSRAWELRAAGSQLTNAYTYTQAAIFGRAIGTFRAALDLLRLGHPIQTWMLTRALFEDLIGALWLTSPDKRNDALETLFQQEDHITLVAERTIRKHQDRIKLKTTSDPELEAMENDLADKFGRYGERSWFRAAVVQHGLGVSQRVVRLVRPDSVVEIEHPESEARLVREVDRIDDAPNDPYDVTPRRDLS